ncbi:hypothetical protein JXM83_00180 [Candidatus Woesearchaeota archaeon]|nr:hypothetical protein [Candidatus Woesearchaeota archaeon]
MIEILSGLLTYVSLFFGAFLAVKTCEELHSGEKYFVLVRQVSLFILLLFGSYAIFGISFFSFGFLVLSGILIVVLNSKKYYDSIIFMLIITISVFVSASKSILLGYDTRILFFPFTFFYGVMQGTLDSKKFIFAIHDYKKFTTQTKFKLTEQVSMYFTIFKKYLLSFIVAIILGVAIFLLK